MRLASWLANWLAGWLAGSLAGGSRGSEDTGRWGEQGGFGPLGEGKVRGTGVDGNGMHAAGRTAAMLRRLLLLLGETAAEKNCC